MSRTPRRSRRSVAALAAPGLILAMAPALLGSCAAPPADPSVLKSEARARFAAGQPTEAMRSLRAATRAAPDDAEAHYLLGVIALRAERPAEAEAALARAVELAPNDPKALSAWGLGLRAQGRYRDAEHALVRSLLLRPGDASTIAALGEVYRLWGHPKQCAVRYEQFVDRLEQGDPAALDPVAERALATARARAEECRATAAAAAPAKH